MLPAKKRTPQMITLRRLKPTLIKTAPLYPGKPAASKAGPLGRPIGAYDPFSQTLRLSPWKVNSPSTDVLGGAPK
jgi:hypothetical protein